MFTWLGYKFGEWLDVWEETHRVHHAQVVLGGNWWLFSGFGFLLDTFLFSLFVFWVRVQVAIP